ncbi:MAG: exodeoxyribonuclease VII small subunit [bacterium]|nr:exodeoxyribonuclease VII small subunit [bacterium]
MPETEKPAPPSFEKGLEELEKVVEQLEDGDLPLEQALEQFEKGVELSETCRQQLEAAETKVEILLKKNDKLTPKPFNPEDR